MTEETKTKAPKKQKASKASAPKLDAAAGKAKAPEPSKAPKTQAPSHPAGSCFAPASRNSGSAVGGR